MDEEEQNPEPLTQIPLLEDMVFDSTLPLKPPKRPKPEGKRIAYSPEYDLDTRDLFEDELLEAEFGIDEDIADELRSSAEEIIDDIVDEFSEEFRMRLRSELTDQLISILEDLKDEPGQARPDQPDK